MTGSAADISFDGQKLRHARGERPLAEIASQAGISRQALHQIEKGKIKPSADILLRLCAILKISLSEFSN